MSSHTNPQAAGKTELDFRVILPFEPALTHEQMLESEKVAQEFGVDRRIVFTVLKTSSDALMAHLENPTEYEILAETVEALIAYGDHLEELQFLTQSAIARLTTVLQQKTGGAA